MGLVRRLFGTGRIPSKAEGSLRDNGSLARAPPLCVDVSDQRLSCATASLLLAHPTAFILELAQSSS